MQDVPLLPMLRDRVVRIDVLRHVDGSAAVLPSTGVVLGLQLRGRVGSERGPLTPVGVTGLQQRVRRYSYVGDAVSILVRFTPQGATSLGVPVSELSGSSLGLDDLFPARRVRDLRDAVLSAPSQREQVDRLQHFLASLPFEADRRITQALTSMERSSGDPAPRVSAIARGLGLSERQLERLFLSRVGVGPRRFASLLRFERAVALARTAPSLTEVAYGAGYADQSHFVREVRRLTGATPTAILRRG
jgi:AraC-like DNA-binding protein